MKKLLLLFTLLYLWSCSNENPVIINDETVNTEQEDIQRAINLVKKISSKLNESSARNIENDLAITLVDSELITLDQKTRSMFDEVLVDSLKLYTFNLKMDGKEGFSIASGDPNIGDVYAYVEDGEISDTIFYRWSIGN